ncbi:hypothetical protein HAX54_034005, partial [Datura stramonium]|nr:hypothetical protein [Datura stramonium]
PNYHGNLTAAAVSPQREFYCYSSTALGSSSISLTTIIFQYTIILTWSKFFQKL